MHSGKILLRFDPDSFLKIQQEPEAFASGSFPLVKELSFVSVWEIRAEILLIITQKQASLVS